ncbi:MAG: sialate O-acetylesterase [Opitutaceae bacterium]|jgi:sialate O-acetylesterase
MKFASALALAGLVIGLTAALRAAVVLPPIFSEHMVLQRSGTTPVWGTATPGEAVNVVLFVGDDRVADARSTAGADGRWRVDLDLSDTVKVPSGKPLRFVVKGVNALSFSDVVVGEVWLASGQSNMARTMAICAAEGEIDASANASIRFFTVANQTATTPLAEVRGVWTVASPANTPRFSAVAYYFARRIQAELGVPVGIVHASWGGTPVEAWTSMSALSANSIAASKAEAQVKDARQFTAQKEAWLKALRPWLVATNRDDAPPSAEQIEAFAKTPVSAEAGWTTVKLPGRLPGERVLWVRRDFEVDSAQAGKTLTLDFDEIVGIDTVYFDGREVRGRTLETFDGDGVSRRNTRREYKVPADAVSAGRHTVAVRIYAPLPGDSGMNGGYFSAGSKNLSGEWQLKTEREFPSLTEYQRETSPGRLKAPLRPWNVPGSLFNGMINGLVPYGLRGVIWYQGENDTGDYERYRTTFPLMIKDWRQRWSAPDLSFYWCQLPNFGSKTDRAHDESNWAGLREAQSLTLALPNTGQAVIIDAGEAGDVHPRDKHLPGERLATIALARDYGRGGEYSGPVFESMQIEGATIRLRFTHLGGGLVVRPVPDEYLYKSTPTRVMRPLTRNRPDSQLEGFAVRDAKGGRWEWADARIEGDTVVVSSSRVPMPSEVRYDWGSNPSGNLYNKAGQPASPFRTHRD